MMRKLFAKTMGGLLAFVIPRIKPPRVIYDRQGLEPYLSRYYLKGRPTMPDGSEPFDKYGNPKPGIQWTKGYGLYLHKFHKSDDDEALHNHPWKWALSLLLTGGYYEDRKVTHGKEYWVRRKVFLPGSFNLITNNTFHRVDLIGKNGWSLFLTGPKLSSWGFWDQDSDEFVLWREFVARHQHGKDSDSG